MSAFWVGLYPKMSEYVLRKHFEYTARKHSTTGDSPRCVGTCGDTYNVVTVRYRLDFGSPH